MCTTSNTAYYELQYRLLRIAILLFYAIFSRSTALQCYVSEPAPNNFSTQIALQECHSTVVSCMKTISWTNNFFSHYCSARKCTTKNGTISNTPTFYNTTDDSQTIFCCYTDRCNFSSKSFKPTLFFIVTNIFILFFSIEY